MSRLIPLIAAACVAAACALNAQPVVASAPIAHVADRLAASRTSLLISADELQTLMTAPALASAPIKVRPSPWRRP